MRLAAMIMMRWKFVIRARGLMVRVAVKLVLLSVEIVVVHRASMPMGRTMRGMDWVEILIIGIVVPMVVIPMLTARILFIGT